MTTILTALLIAWLAWVALNFLAMVLGDRMLKPEHAHFNGFRVRIPESVLAKLTEQELAAVIEHENGHRAHWHPWKNLARLCLFIPLTQKARRLQEYRADDYCKAPLVLAAAIRKLSRHPFDLRRADRLEVFHELRVAYHNAIRSAGTTPAPYAQDGRVSNTKEANIL